MNEHKRALLERIQSGTVHVGIIGMGYVGLPLALAFLDSGDVAAALYARALDQVVRVRSARVAEATKLTENIFRGVNIALVNELKVVHALHPGRALDGAKLRPQPERARGRDQPRHAALRRGQAAGRPERPPQAAPRQ